MYHYLLPAAAWLQVEAKVSRSPVIDCTPTEDFKALFSPYLGKDKFIEMHKEATSKIGEATKEWLERQTEKVKDENARVAREIKDLRDQFEVMSLSDYRGDVGSHCEDSQQWTIYPQEENKSGVMVPIQFRG